MRIHFSREKHLINIHSTTIWIHKCWDWHPRTWIPGLKLPGKTWIPWSLTNSKPTIALKYAPSQRLLTTKVILTMNGAAHVEIAERRMPWWGDHPRKGHQHPHPPLRRNHQESQRFHGIYRQYVPCSSNEVKQHHHSRFFLKMSDNPKIARPIQAKSITRRAFRWEWAPLCHRHRRRSSIRRMRIHCWPLRLVSGHPRL